MNLLVERLRSSLWPIPLLMLLASVLLVQATRAVDAQLSEGEALHAWWLHSGNGDDARNLLSTLASAVVTISSLVFSMTIVALSLAAAQFGTRLVRLYMRALRTKLALGFFLLTVVFCLLALRLVSQDMAPADVPHVTVTTGLVLSVCCVLVLLFYLHEVARSIVADEVIRREAVQLDQSIDALEPLADYAEAAHDAAALLPPDFEQHSALLLSDAEGYVQEIHYEQLLAHAEAHDLFMRIDLRAGDYLCKAGWVGRVYPASGCQGEMLRVMRQAVVLGGERTPVQDLAYPLRHLVDIALRALSPGINDSNTALVVIDRLRGALSRLLGKSLPSGIFRDAQGRCRVLARRHSHAQVIDAALHPIRDAAAPLPLVLVALLQALNKMAEHARREPHCEALAQQAGHIAAMAGTRSISHDDRRLVDDALAAFTEKLAQVRQMHLRQQRGG